MSISEAITSCTECPNFRKQTLSDGRAIGSCTVFNQTIFVGGISPAGHLEATASTCSMAGVKSSTPDPEIFRVTAPNGALPDPISPAELVSCMGCINFADRFHDELRDDVSLAHLCRAKGNFILDKNDDCKGCFYAKLGAYEATPVRLNASVFDGGPSARGEAADDGALAGADTSSVKGSPIAEPAVAKRKRNALINFDPLTYVSDMELREADKGKIMAWRLIEVGEGRKRKGVYLPIYDPEFFTSGQRETIPQTGDTEHPELYHDGSGIEEAFAITSWMKGQALCFVGEPGVGKTEAARWLAWKMQMPFTHLQITEETLPDEFLGTPAYHPELGTYFKKGRLPRAAEVPGILLSDEPNLGQPAIVQTYRAFNITGDIFLEGEDAENVVVSKNKDCFHLLSLNPSWDARNLGTAELADADVRRMSYKFVDEPNEAIVKDIIVSKLEADGVEILADDLAALMKTRKDLKAMSRTGELPFSWSIAQDVKVAQNLELLEGPSAYQRALLDYCSPDVAEMALKAVQSHFGFTRS